MIDHYNPDTHKGGHPIRVLAHNVVAWWEQEIDPTFLAQARAEVVARRLDPGIGYHIDGGPIRSTPCIIHNVLTGFGKIHVQENYLQFQWCVCYALWVYYVEGFVKPQQSGDYNGWIDPKNVAIQTAKDVLKEGMALWERVKPRNQFLLPNPEEVEDANAQLISHVNGVYVAATSFILMHEFAHHLRKHYLEPHSKKQEEEADADALAAFRKGQGVNRAKDNTNTIGAISAMIAIALQTEKLGRTNYPEPQERVKAAVDALNQGNDEFYAIACFGLTLWSHVHGKTLDLHQPHQPDYRSLFESIVKQLEAFR